MAKKLVLLDKFKTHYAHFVREMDTLGYTALIDKVRSVTDTDLYYRIFLKEHDCFEIKITPDKKFWINMDPINAKKPLMNVQFNRVWLTFIYNLLHPATRNIVTLFHTIQPSILIARQPLTKLRDAWADNIICEMDDMLVVTVASMESWIELLREIFDPHRVKLLY